MFCLLVVMSYVFLLYSSTRAESGGGETQGGPDELAGRRTREDAAVPAGDRGPQDAAHTAGERNG